MNGKVISMNLSPCFIALLHLAGFLGELHAEELLDLHRVAFRGVAVADHHGQLQVENRTSGRGGQGFELRLQHPDFALVGPVALLNRKGPAALAVKRFLLLLHAVLDRADARDVAAAREDGDVRPFVLSAVEHGCWFYAVLKPSSTSMYLG